MRKATRFPLYVAARTRPNNHQNAMINVAGPKFFLESVGQTCFRKKQFAKLEYMFKVNKLEESESQI